MTAEGSSFDGDFVVQFIRFQKTKEFVQEIETVRKKITSLNTLHYPEMLEIDNNRGPENKAATR